MRITIKFEPIIKISGVSRFKHLSINLVICKVKIYFILSISSLENIG